jgi:phosphoglucosamine mutase
MGKLFGTDGVRGVANDLLTPELACALGKAGAYVLQKTESGRPPVVLIGKDTRISGDMLEDGLSAGIMSMGGTAIKGGVLPTPAVAYLVRDMRADCGIVISASHNSFEYNGIKFFNRDGYKLDDDIEELIEDIVLNNKDVSSHITGRLVGYAPERTEDALHRYTEHLLKGVSPEGAEAIRGMKIVIDSANGAAFKAAKSVFSSLGADLVMIGDEPNGTNINDKVGSTHPDTLCKAVQREGAVLGLAFDGDADRLIAADERGRVIDGDQIMYLCATHMKRLGSLKNNLLIATKMSNLGLSIALEKEDVDIKYANVGDRYVLELMQRTGAVIGGEQSGHIIFLDRNTTGDGMFAALRLIEAIASTGKKASEAADEVQIFPQVLVNATVREENKKQYLIDPDIVDRTEKIERKMEGQGRVMIRPSGTEPLVRVMIEGNDKQEIEADAKALAALIEERLG